MFDWTFCCTVMVSLTSSCCYRSCYTIVIISSSKGKFQSLFGFSTLILFSNWLALVYVAKFDIKVYKEPRVVVLPLWAMLCIVTLHWWTVKITLLWFVLLLFSLSLAVLCINIALLCWICWTLVLVLPLWVIVLLASWCIFHTSSGALMWHRQILLLR